MSAPVVVEGAPLPASTDPQFSVTQQEVELDVDFKSQKLTGKTTIIIEPLSKELKTISLGCRSLKVTSISVDAHRVQLPAYRDPYAAFDIRDGYGVQQHHQIRDNVHAVVKDPADPVLVVDIPKQVRIREINASQAQGAHYDGPTEAALANNLAEGEAMFEPITVIVEYVVEKSRDSLAWIGLQESDSRYPHVYTCASSLPGSLPCFVFPYMGTTSSKYSWKLTITCPRTLGDLYWRPGAAENGVDTDDADAMDVDASENDPFTSLSTEEKNRDIQVIGSGVVEDSDAPCDHNEHRRRWGFQCSVAVAPVNVGFAIGPFEEVDFSEFRESGKEDQLKDHAVGVKGYCLPGRADELKNTCLPLQMAVDSFMQSYISYPFAPECQTYKMCFVDDLARDVIDTATMSLCSSRLLYPETIIDNVWEVSRTLIRAAASQWLGVFITPKNNVDYWIVVGGSFFMAETFMAHLWGRNELRYRQKIASDQVKERDRGMPSIYDAGQAVHLDPAELEYLELKAPLVLFLLHQRLIKQSGAVGVIRILTRMLSDARSGKLTDNEIWTERFRYTTEKVAHSKVANFFDQWVYGAGIPSFLVSQAFQKKKFSVAITIKQTQKMELGLQGQELQPSNFFREVKEAENDIYAPALQESFTGPMTIRVHEPSGMPYEQIVEIRDGETKVEFHYNSKNKNQLRKRRARQREMAAAGQAHVVEDGDDFIPTYSLGDILMSPQELVDWGLENISTDQEKVLENASYEWVRVDKDFEWIANTTFHPGAVPGELDLMYIMQLQGDNDVVAHLEALERLAMLQPTELLSSIFLRTLMDSRYFYGVRVKAAQALVMCAVESTKWIGYFHLRKAFQTLFCFPNTVKDVRAADGSLKQETVQGMPRPNDFSDLRLYRIRCAIVQAMSSIQTSNAVMQKNIKEFYLDTLKFNDNTSNQSSDSFYVAYLISGLTRTLASSHSAPVQNKDREIDYRAEAEKAHLKRSALSEIDRMRRIDEWIPSYRNVHTRAALRGLVDLMQLKIIPKRTSAFLPYTRPGNQDEVRLEAFEHLIKLGMMAQDSFFRYIFSTLASEPSAYFRERLWQRIHRGLSSIALGETDLSKTPEPVNNGDGLVIENGPAPQVRQEVVDKTSIDGGLKWLRLQLKDNKALQESLMDALRSPTIGIKDFVELLDLCYHLYDAKDELRLRLRYPHYWQVEHIGEAGMRFTHSPKYRTQPMSRPDKKRKSTADDRAASPQIKRQKTGLSISFHGLAKKDTTTSPSSTGQHTLPSPGPSQPTFNLARQPSPLRQESPEVPLASRTQAPVAARAVAPLAPKRASPAAVRKPSNSPAVSSRKGTSPSIARSTPPRSTPPQRKQKRVILKFQARKREFAEIVAPGSSMNGMANGHHEGSISPQSNAAPPVLSPSLPNKHVNGVKTEQPSQMPLSSIPAPVLNTEVSPATTDAPKKPAGLKLKIKFGGGGQK